MSGRIGKSTNWPQDVAGAQMQAEREDMWGEMPGRVLSVNYAGQTMAVQPLYKKRLNGVPTDLPMLPEVPFNVPRGGFGAITYPIQPGDRVLLRPQMRNSEGYHNAAGSYEAADTRSFNLSDMEAYPDGGESLSDPIPNYDPANIHVRFSPQGEYGIRGSKDGKFLLEGNQGELMDLIATALEALAADQLVIAYGSSAGSGHALSNASVYADLAAKFRAMTL